MNIQKKLIDYLDWKKCNKNNFSLFDYIFGIIEFKKLKPSFFYALIKLVNPDFIEKDGMIFLKEQFNQKKYKSLVDKTYTKKEIEYWINLIGINSFFIDEDWQEIAFFCAQEIREIWIYKLHKEFPNKNIIVEIVNDDELYLVFYQNN